MNYPQQGLVAANDERYITPTKTVCYAVSNKTIGKYITKGYEHVIRHAYLDGFVCYAFNGVDIFCLYEGCEHLAGGKWRIIVREELV